MVMTASDAKRPDGRAHASEEGDRLLTGGHPSPAGEAADGGARAEEAAASNPRPRLRLFGRQFPLPASRPWRIALGASLVGGGVLGFLPILGFWMLPLGLFVLSVDSPWVRRGRRRSEIRFARWRNARKARRADAAKGPGADGETG